MPYQHISQHEPTLENMIAHELMVSGKETGTKPTPLHYVQPAITKWITPDALLKQQAIAIFNIRESSPLTYKRRCSLRFLRNVSPDLDIRFVIEKPEVKLNSNSEVSFDLWCKTHGFPYVYGTIPAEWYEHQPSDAQREALDEAIGKNASTEEAEA